MATERRQKSAAEILGTLHDFSLDTDEEILSMSSDQVKARLAEEGINLDSAKTELTNRLRTIRGQQKLAQAHEHRLAKENTIANRSTHQSLDFPQMRAEVQRRISQLSSQQPHVQVYFHRFQESTDDDLLGLLEDLLILEEQSKDGN